MHGTQRNSTSGRILSVAALAASLVLASCSSSTVAPSLPIANLSGDYTGTFQDSVDGSSAATATFAQHGATIGGAIAATLASVTLNVQTTLTLSTSNAVTGALVIDEPSGTQCTFSTTGTYNPNTNVLAGSFTAVSNCSGETGSYSLTQNCTATPASVDRRTLGLPSRC